MEVWGAEALPLCCKKTFQNVSILSILHNLSAEEMSISYRIQNDFSRVLGYASVMDRF